MTRSKVKVNAKTCTSMIINLINIIHSLALNSKWVDKLMWPNLVKRWPKRLQTFCANILMKLRCYLRAGHHCGCMSAKQMGSSLWWMSTFWKRACSVLLQKVTSTSPARDQVCYQAVIGISSFATKFCSLIWRSWVWFLRPEIFSHNSSYEKGGLTPKNFPIILPSAQFDSG